MSLLQHIGSLYSLETLDTRFTTSSRTPPSQIDPANSTGKSERPRSEKHQNEATAPKWKTPEFGVYGLVFLIAVPWMFYTVYDISQRTLPETQGPLSFANQWQLGTRIMPNLSPSCLQGGYWVVKLTIQMLSTPASETTSHTCSS